MYLSRINSEYKMCCGNSDSYVKEITQTIYRPIYKTKP